MMGEEDVVKPKGTYTTTLRCSSQKGTLLKMKREEFMRLRKIGPSWAEVMGQVAFKKFRQKADDIEAVSAE